MLINELAQWAVLIFLAVLALGLTRQLGNFIVPRREQIAGALGPELGRVVGGPILREDEAARLRTMIDAGPTDWASLIVINEQCIGCDAMLDALEQNGKPEGAPVLALSRELSPDHRARVGRLVDELIVDEARLTAAELTTTPFVMIVDDELKLRFKAVLPSLELAADQWLTGIGRGPEGSEAQSSPYVLQVEGGRGS